MLSLNIHGKVSGKSYKKKQKQKNTEKGIKMK